jgi:hypothetical protein
MASSEYQIVVTWRDKVTDRNNRGLIVAGHLNSIDRLDSTKTQPRMVQLDDITRDILPTSTWGSNELGIAFTMERIPAKKAPDQLITTKETGQIVENRIA